MPIAISNAGLCGGVIGTSSTYILYKMYSMYLFICLYDTKILYITINSFCQFTFVYNRY